jgi:hypothetical protein
MPARTPRTIGEVLDIDRESRTEALGLVEARTGAAV